MSDRPPSWLGAQPPLDLIAGPAPFYVSGEDNLQLLSFCTTAGVLLTLCGRFLSVDGRVQPFVFEGHAVSGTGALVTTRHALGEGWVLNLSVFAGTGAPLGSACPVIVRVARGHSGATQTLGVIAQGFVTTTAEVTWPLTAGSASGASSANGLIRSVTGTNPAAGVEISETVPTGKVWRLISIRAVLVTNATVTNRTVNWILDDGVNQVFGCPSPIVQTATQTDNYSLAEGRANDGSAGQFVVIGLPVNTRLGAGFRIRTSTNNLQAGDDFAAPQMHVEEWSA